MDRWFLITAIAVLCILLYGAYQATPPYNRYNQTNLAPLKPEYPVKKITVLQGHEFDITLMNSRRILARLPIKTPPEAKQKVVSHLNYSFKPRCVVFDQNPDFWVVDLLLEDSRMTNSSLIEWLQQQNLVWDN